MDLRILRAYQARPEVSMVELSNEVGLSQAPCWRRLRRMDEQGLIRGRANLFYATALGFAVNVFANVRIKQHDEETLEAFEVAVREHPEVVECFSMTGESDYVLRVLARSIEDYERFFKKVMLHLPGVASINSSFAVKPVKMTTAIPV